MHCDTNNRVPWWTFTGKPEVRPGAREESASPVWLGIGVMSDQWRVSLIMVNSTKLCLNISYIFLICFRQCYENAELNCTNPQSLYYIIVLSYLQIMMFFHYKPYSTTVRRGHRRLAIDVTELLFHIIESHVPFSQDQRARKGYKLNAFLSLFAGKILEVIKRNKWKNMHKNSSPLQKHDFDDELSF